MSRETEKSCLHQFAIVNVAAIPLAIFLAAIPLAIFLAAVSSCLSRLLATGAKEKPRNLAPDLRSSFLDFT